MDATAWDEVELAIGAAPYPVTVLPADAASAEESLSLLEITTRSWLGAVVANSGGLVVDHGWLRVLGSGHGGLPSVAASADPASGLLVVAYDVLGGQFAWVPATPRARPTIHYFGPDVLAWQDLEEPSPNGLSDSETRHRREAELGSREAPVARRTNIRP